MMAEPKTEIDRRLDRIELAIATLATVLAQEEAIGLDEHEVKEICNILKRDF